MKRSILKLQILLLGLLLMNNPIFSQSKFELSGGFGIPELLNVKARYGHNLQVGASIGLLGPFEWYGGNVWDWSCTAEILYHFAGKSKYTEQPTWYLSGGLGIHHLNLMCPFDYCYESYDISFNPRIGKTLNLSKKTGLNCDIGVFLPLSMSQDESLYNKLDFKVLPSGSISFFIRL
jgi:hypothetical protein